MKPFDDVLPLHSKMTQSAVENPVTLPDCDQLQEVVKGLRQKLRYAEIEIDILKKMKGDSSKMKEDIEKLKAKNRKLLGRIDCMARSNRRGRRNSDESLELSLSPKRF
jgi:hypothetical protein